MEFRAKNCTLTKINALQYRRARSLPPSVLNLWTQILGDMLDFDVHRIISLTESSKSVHGNIGHSGVSLSELHGFIFQYPYKRTFEVRRGQNLGCFL